MGSIDYQLEVDEDKLTAMANLYSWRRFERQLFVADNARQASALRIG